VIPGFMHPRIGGDCIVTDVHSVTRVVAGMRFRRGVENLLVSEFVSVHGAEQGNRCHT
jgi:hypothetical protein